MFLRTQGRRFIPHDTESLARFGCQLIALFALQGIIILGYYAISGAPNDPTRLPVGLQLDAIHAVVHLAVGLAGGYVGFFRTSAAMGFLRGFGVLYLALAVFGTFTDTHFGMHLEFNENALHWTVGTIAVIVGFGLVPDAALRKLSP